MRAFVPFALLFLLLSACSAPPTLTITPLATELTLGQNQAFVVESSAGTPVGVLWEVTGGNVQTDGARADYTAPEQAGVYTVSAFEARAPDRRVSATVTVRGVLNLDPDGTEVAVGGSLTLAAELKGYDDTSLEWTASGGVITVNETGALWRAPDEPGDYRVVARSRADPALSADVMLTVVAAPARLDGPMPKNVELSAAVGESVSDTFKLRNVGASTLTFGLDVPEDAADWLNLDRLAGLLSPADAVTITATASCPPSPVTLRTTVTITSDDPDRPAVGVEVTVACHDAGAEGFTIDLRFVGEVSKAQRKIFKDAAARWSKVIRGDLPDVALTKPANACDSGEPKMTETIDDVVIYAVIEPIDDVGGILGSAGPCYYRTGSFLPINGRMRFDSADVANLEEDGTFEAVILHEMGHVLGFGTLWGDSWMDLLAFDGADCSQSATVGFIGADAGAEYLALGGSGNVPVENGGGAGTRCGHWDEETFDNELMTGYLGGQTGGNPLSRLTAAALVDMGYSVNMGAADAYTLPSCSPSCIRIQGAGLAIADHEQLLPPIGPAPGHP